MRGRGERVRLFENDLLERLSRIHPLTPLLLWMSLIAAFLWRALTLHRLQPEVVAALTTAGLLVWSLTEYLIHRFVFHLETISPVGRRLQFIVHGVHHEAPDDPMRLLMPLAPAIAGFAILYGLFRIVLGPGLVEPFSAGFLMGYLIYDYLHFAIHRTRPRMRLVRYLRRRHMLHHFVTPDARWGVTSPLWDAVFRTTGTTARSASPTDPTTRPSRSSSGHSPASAARRRPAPARGRHRTAGARWPR